MAGDDDALRLAALAQAGRAAGGGRWLQRERSIGLGRLVRCVMHRGRAGRRAWQLGRQPAAERGDDLRQRAQPLAQPGHIARGGHASPLDDAVDYPLHISGVAQLVADDGALHCIVDEVLHRVLAQRERIERQQRLLHPAPEQPRSHRRAGMIEHLDQRALLLAAAALQQLKVAPRLRVEEHHLADASGAQRGERDAGVWLGLGDILYQRAGGPDGQRPVGEAKAG